MYIVAIAWLYVLLLVSIMQPSVFRGIVTFIGAGLLPLALLLYLMGTPQRRRNRAQADAQSGASSGASDGQDEGMLTKMPDGTQQNPVVDGFPALDAATEIATGQINPTDSAR